MASQDRCRVVLYARVSTEKQAQEGHGLDAQRSRLMEFAREKGLAVVEVVVDEGVSAKTLDRAGLARVLELADAGEVDAVVVTKADRVSRNVRDLLNLGARLEERGVSLVTADEQFDTSSPIGRAMNAMRAVFAQLEREMAAARTREGMAAARRKGVRLGRPPVGWRIEDGQWERDPERFPLVERAHALRSEGLTLVAIADLFNQEGLPNGGSFGRWGTSAIRRLLKSPLQQEAA